MDFNTVRKNKPVYIPKIASRHQAINFDKAKITDKPLGPEKYSGVNQNSKRSNNNSGRSSIKGSDNSVSRNSSKNSDYSEKSQEVSKKKVESSKNTCNIFLNNDLLNDSQNKNKKRTSNSLKIVNQEENEDFSTKRDDLLHKKNLDCITECFKKGKEKNFDIFGVDKMLFDLNWEEI